ncbi:helix-turn-helix domain-containing protein [Streptomyces reniochalinae]|uniref:XRE family transcriptional regulator n=1 Tax=Streptomyces reniochalinae TaxID=2250578 RepID=A0A367E5K2_9ACTN|nr:helix-turn-helix transcriptional regulator [Streptomyces reniochalinae]RCG13263.1 XRE family transcriptional regulator [Streptomyces reniochalinae]
MRSVTNAHLAPTPAEHVKPGELVRRIRQKQGFSLEKLGQQTGFSAAQVSRLERGKSPMTVEALRTFARALDTPPKALGLLLEPDPSDRHGGPSGPYPRVTALPWREGRTT